MPGQSIFPVHPILLCFVILAPQLVIPFIIQHFLCPVLINVFLSADWELLCNTSQGKRTKCGEFPKNSPQCFYKITAISIVNDGNNAKN